MRKQVLPLTSVGEDRDVRWASTLGGAVCVLASFVAVGILAAEVAQMLAGRLWQGGRDGLALTRFLLAVGLGFAAGPPFVYFMARGFRLLAATRRS